MDGSESVPLTAADSALLAEAASEAGGEVGRSVLRALAERDRLRERVKELEAALKALAHRHGWEPELGPCVCDEHRRAADILGEG